MTVIAVIPARYGSTRFPGKPLHEIAGVPMVERVRRLAAAAPSIDQVIVATDDTRILDAVKAFGGEAVMTPESCRNGTERAFEAVKGFAKEKCRLPPGTPTRPSLPPHPLSRAPPSL